MPEFQTVMDVAPDGAIRLLLLGELDFAAIPSLRDELERVMGAHRVVRIDLSRLDFIDATGLRTIASAVADAGRNSRTLTLAQPLAPQVRRVIEFAEAAGSPWPAPNEGLQAA